MSRNLEQPDRDPLQSTAPGQLVIRHLLTKLSREGQPRMAEKHVVQRNGHTYVQYRRPDQIRDGSFKQTSLGGDFYTHDFRGAPGNITTAFTDESGANISGDMGHIFLPHRPGGDIKFIINGDGTLDEILSDHGTELRRVQVGMDGVTEITDLIDNMQPGTIWWQDGAPQFPDEQPS